VLGRADTFALAFGAMIGWSWIVLAGSWVQNAGALGAAVALLVGGGLILILGVVYAELAAAMPQVGGEHVYSLRALGAGASFVCTWALVLGYVSVVAFEAVALSTAVDYLLPGRLQVGRLWTVAGFEVHAGWAAVGVVGALAMTAINVLGIRVAGALQTATTWIILAVGVFFLAGSVRGGAVANLEPPFVGGAAGMAAVLVMVPFMFVGFDVLPQAAEEAAIPPRDLGRLLVLAVAVAVGWYLMISLGVAASLSRSELASVRLATPDAAAAAWNSPRAGQILVAGGVAGILTSWNAFLVGGSRAIFALAEAGMLPRSLGRLHPRFRTPHVAVLAIGALSLVAPFFGRPALVWLVDAGGLGIVVAYALVALSFLALRRNEPELERPFRVPAGRAVGIVALVLSVALALLYLPGSPAALRWPEEWIIVLAWTVAGAVLFVWARRAGLHRSHPKPPPPT
jgi:amino acid transporter